MILFLLRQKLFICFWFQTTKNLNKSFWKIQKIEKIFSQFNKSFPHQSSFVLLMRILSFGHQTYFSNLVILLSLKAKNDILILRLGSTEQTYFSPRQDLAICKLFNYFLTLWLLFLMIYSCLFNFAFTCLTKLHYLSTVRENMRPNDRLFC